MILIGNLDLEQLIDTLIYFADPIPKSYQLYCIRFLDFFDLESNLGTC